MKIKILKLIKKSYYNMKLKSKLLTAFIILITIPTFFTGLLFYNTSSKTIMQRAEDNIFEIVRKNNLIIDQKLKSIEYDAQKLVVDRELYDIFNRSREYSEYDRILAVNRINRILFKYFTQYEHIVSACIVSQNLSFRDSWDFIPHEKIKNSSLYSKAVMCEGEVFWYPTFNFSDMFEKQDNFNTNNPYIFSVVKVLNCSYIENGLIINMPEDKERPVLMINLNENLFRDVFEESINIDGAYYCVTTREGKVVSHSNPELRTENLHAQWMDDAVEKVRGTKYISIDGNRTLVCYETSEITGWISVVAVPVDKMLEGLNTLQYYSFYAAIVLAVFSVMLAFIISGRITKPIKKLLVAIKQMGEGRLHAKVEESGNDEMGYLVKKFNQMDDKIRNLIEENYEVKLKEKEAQIRALNFQLNPHFLYNTLNVINWMAMENNQTEISRMLVSLSSMLQYTANGTGEMVEFKEDFEWLKCYNLIMVRRFEGKFSVEYEIDSSLLELKVPRLFLQPFVENAIIHGFESVESGGLIIVSAWKQRNKAFFRVKDNGSGMSEDKIEEVLNQSPEAIGVYNVQEQLKLIYGASYGVHITSASNEGTTVTIVIPFK